MRDLSRRRLGILHHLRRSSGAGSPCLGDFARDDNASRILEVRDARMPRRRKSDDLQIIDDILLLAIKP